MAIQTKYKVFLGSSFLDQNLAPVYDSDLAGVWTSLDLVDEIITASGSIDVEYEIISYKQVVE